MLSCWIEQWKHGSCFVAWVGKRFHRANYTHNLSCQGFRVLRERSRSTTVLSTSLNYQRSISACKWRLKRKWQSSRNNIVRALFSSTDSIHAQSLVTVINRINSMNYYHATVSSTLNRAFSNNWRCCGTANIHYVTVAHWPAIQRFRELDTHLSFFLLFFF